MRALLRKRAPAKCEASPGKGRSRRAYPPKEGTFRAVTFRLEGFLIGEQLQKKRVGFDGADVFGGFSDLG